MNTLHKRILDLSYTHGLSHLSSCLTAVDIIDEIYSKKSPDHPFVLSQGHAGLALYVVLEKYLGVNAEVLLKRYGVHPKRNEQLGIYCSAGSLGCGLPIALGMAMADPNTFVYCLISDGESAEGGIWEALRIKSDHRVYNLKIFLNANGTSAYDEVDLTKLKDRIWAFDQSVDIRETNVNQYPFLKGIDGHYYKMSKEDYENATQT